MTPGCRKSHCFKSPPEITHSQRGFRALTFLAPYEIALKCARQPNTMFHKCSNFQIIGGVFIGHPESRSSRTRRALTNPSFLANFHRVRLGDLKLISEIGKEEIVEYHEVRRRKTGALIRRNKVVVGERRRFEASVSGRPETLTAVVYKDTNIDKWRIEVEKHETFRHPSLVQLYGVTVSPANYALIYTDALIPLRDVRELHANSSLASTYVEYGIVRRYFSLIQ
ncbi:hypothetical protein B0H14DRAFT_1616330 [Mycena olivaceomarginata]|nr:hypothetical protein B0H14DRAFT_1616330 [Mycena olivaceomarginata]